MKYNINESLSPNFKLWEFIKNKSTEGLKKTIYQNLKALAFALEGARKTCGNRPIKITSGFRTARHNAAVGGAPSSTHLLGLAADIQVSGLTARQVQALLEDWRGGLGTYPTWTHLDLGSFRRWSEG